MSGTGGAPNIKASNLKRSARAAAIAVLSVATIAPGLAHAGTDDTAEPTTTAAATTTSTTFTTTTTTSTTTTVESVPSSVDPTTTATTVPTTTAPTTTATTVAPATTEPTTPPSNVPTTTSDVPPSTAIATTMSEARATAATAAAPTGRACITRNLAPGQWGADVVCLKDRLRGLGYTVAATVTYDVGTTNAIRDVRRRGGFNNASNAPAFLLDHVFSSRAQTVGRTWALNCITRNLAPGDRGTDVVCLKNQLRNLGYTIAATITYDVGTTNAIRDVRRRAGLNNASNAPAVVLSHLFSPAAQRVTSTWAFNCISRPLAPGDRGADVTCLKNRLRSLGYPISGTITYDVGTTNAIRDARRLGGLNGADNAPAVVLNYVFSGRIATDKSQFGLPANSGSGRRVVFSRPQQRVWAVDSNGSVVKTHRVSGRMYEPYAGTYSVYSRSMYTFSTANPDIKWRYMVRFTYGPGGGRIGFHEIPKKFGVPLQSVSQLGQPLSGGCVRQSTPDAQWMWNWAGLGTKVVVL